jgi:hypothetical protein
MIQCQACLESFAGRAKTDLRNQTATPWHNFEQLLMVERVAGFAKTCGQSRAVPGALTLFTRACSTWLGGPVIVYLAGKRPMRFVCPQAQRQAGRRPS